MSPPPRRLAPIAIREQGSYHCRGSSGGNHWIPSSGSRHVPRYAGKASNGPSERGDFLPVRRPVLPLSCWLPQAGFENGPNLLPGGGGHSPFVSRLTKVLLAATSASSQAGDRILDFLAGTGSVTWEVPGTADACRAAAPLPGLRFPRPML